jgi:hypothetical protein
LNNINVYEKFDNNILDSTVINIKETLDNLFDERHICYKVLSILREINSKLGKFRVLLKVHKENFGLRPIINSKNTPTYNLCKMIKLLLNPFVSKFKSFIQDSQNLMQDLENKLFGKNSIIYSADIESLYTNINLNLALDIITDFSKDKLDLEQISTFGFREILKLIFNHNIFTYDNKFYKQISGIAMGSVCGPTLANIFVNFLEVKWYSIAKPLYYKRFIDDLCIIDNENMDINFF